MLNGSMTRLHHLTFHGIESGLPHRSKTLQFYARNLCKQQHTPLQAPLSLSPGFSSGKIVCPRTNVWMQICSRHTFESTVGCDFDET